MSKNDREAILLRGYVSPNDTGIMGQTDSESIQNAVDTALALDIGKVVIPKYNRRIDAMGWEISKTILLDSNIRLVLDDCYLRMADGVYENFFRTANVFTPTGPRLERELTNIHIQGIGSPVLDGGNPNGLDEGNHTKNGRPHVGVNSPILFFNVRYFSVSNITIRDQRYWGMRFAYCKCGRIADIFICAHRDRSNQDGINLRNGCNHVVIENVYAQTGDDTIALSAIDMERKDRFNMVDPNQDSDIHDVVVRNISGCALIHPLVALRNHNGVRMYNVRIENIRDTDPLEPWMILCGANDEKYFHVQFSQIHDSGAKWTKGNFIEYKYGMIRIGDAGYYDTRPAQLGETFGITVRNAICTTSERAIVVGCALRDSNFSNIQGSAMCRCILGTAPVGIDGGPGIKLENVLLEKVLLRDSQAENATVVDFRNQREGDYVQDLCLRDVHTRNASHLLMVSGKAKIYLENIHNEHMTGESLWRQNGAQDSVILREKEATC